MRILFDIVHPAQVHFFKHAIWQLQERGHKVMVTARDKDVTLNLLEALDIEYISISKKSPSVLGMAGELIIRDIRLLRIAMRFRPDVIAARVGVSAGIVGTILGVPTVIFDDMEHARLQAAVGMTFATYICTGLGYYRDFGKRQVHFQGPPVLAYLDPHYFTPDVEPLRRFGLDPEQRYIFVRIVSWGAAHDLGRYGSSETQLQQMIDRLLRFGRVIISSEEPLAKSLEQYRNPVPVEHMHNLLAFASLSMVEGGTMAAESAVLGVPAICLNSYDFGYLRALETKYGLIFRPGSQQNAVDIAEKLLSQTDLHAVWQKKRQKLLADSEDVVMFMFAMIERACREHPLEMTIATE